MLLTLREPTEESRRARGASVTSSTRSGKDHHEASCESTKSKRRRSGVSLRVPRTNRLAEPKRGVSVRRSRGVLGLPVTARRPWLGCASTTVPGQRGSLSNLQSKRAR